MKTVSKIKAGMKSKTYKTVCKASRKKISIADMINQKSEWIIGTPSLDIAAEFKRWNNQRQTYPTQSQRSPPSAGFLLFQGTLAKLSNCSGNRGLQGMAPFSAPRLSGWRPTQCFPPTVPSKNVLTICGIDEGVQKNFSKKSVDGSLIFPYSTTQSEKGGSYAF